ncbi:MFS transporter [Streptomyces sp. NPDC049577]|uniref:MFS transporter n=1 Tax=Streptomyces sp. NPDC049577 TaxID=3155153 RepID=UPI003430AFBC
MKVSTKRRVEQAPFGATVTVMAVVAVLVVGQTFVTIPLMSRLGSAWGVSEATAAWSTTAFAVAYACGSLVSGPLSNRYGRRAVMVVSIAGMAVATALVPLAGNLPSGAALRALQGALAGSFVPMSYAYLAERVDPRRLPLALTTVNCASGASVVIGQVEAQLFDSALGWRAVFLISAPLLALAAAATWKVMLPGIVRVPEGAATGAAPAPTGPGIHRSARLWPLYTITLTVVGGLTAIYTGVQLYGPSAVVDDHGTMLALRASALPAMVLAVLISPMLGRIPALRRLIGALAVSAAGMIGVALTTGSVVGLGVTLFVFVIGITTVGPAIVQGIGDGTGTAARATGIAIYGFVLNLGSGLGAQVPLALGKLSGLALLLAAVFVIGIGLVAFAGRAARRAAESTGPTAGSTAGRPDRDDTPLTPPPAPPAANRTAGTMPNPVPQTD